KALQLRIHPPILSPVGRENVRLKKWWIKSRSYRCRSHGWSHRRERRCESRLRRCADRCLTRLSGLDFPHCIQQRLLTLLGRCFTISLQQLSEVSHQIRVGEQVGPI